MHIYLKIEFTIHTQKTIEFTKNIENFYLFKKNVLISKLILMTGQNYRNAHFAVRSHFYHQKCEVQSFPINQDNH